MDISEAIKKANTNQGIRRKTWYDMFVVPTNTENCCLVYVDNKLRSIRWNPKKEDLIAKDWSLSKRRN